MKSKDALSLLIPEDLQTHIDFTNKYGSSIKGFIKKDLDRLEKLERIFEILQKHMYACRGFMELRITTPKNYKEALKNSWTRYYNGVDVTDKDYDELYDLWLEVLKK